MPETAGPYEYVIDKYAVPVHVGQRVDCQYGGPGTVVTPEQPDQYVHVRTDRDGRVGRHHPLSVDYGDGITIQQREDHHNARIDTFNDWLNQRISPQEFRQRMRRPLSTHTDA